MHSKIFLFFWLECTQGTKVTLVLHVQRCALFLSKSTIHGEGIKIAQNSIEVVCAWPLKLIASTSSTKKKESIRYYYICT